MTTLSSPSPASTLGDVTALDRAALERLRRFGGDALVAQMIKLFITSGRERLDAARVAAASGDCAGVQRSFHALKSSAGQLGAIVLQAICERGEAISAEGNAAPLLKLVSIAYEQFLVAVRFLRDELPAAE